MRSPPVVTETSERAWIVQGIVLRKCIDTSGHAGRRGAPSGQVGTYTLVDGCACARASCSCASVSPCARTAGHYVDAEKRFRT
eukprot:871114-Prymnesium_polylepis.1